MKIDYCHSLLNYKRFETLEVEIGSVLFGGNHPVRVQSMTNTDTKNIDESIEQSKRIFDAGADLVRLTIPSVKDIDSLRLIKSGLVKDNYLGPVSADVHFTSEIALKAASVVEKVRINPGNFVRSANSPTIDKRKALAIIEDRLLELVQICFRNNTAIRIGTNHGSLAERIIHEFGDTAEGMVESTMEYLRIISKAGFRNVIVSLKSSNVLVMIHANRMLVGRMKIEGMNFPLHLGVTEAGEGEDGRIKSAIGIGSLLHDGIGDTIRVSLTEDPENEIPVCNQIVKKYEGLNYSEPIEEIDYLDFNPFSFKRIKRENVLNIGNENVPVVICDLSSDLTIDKFRIDNLHFDKDQVPDYLYLGAYNEELPERNNIPLIIDYAFWSDMPAKDNVYPIMNVEEYLYSNLDSVLFLKMNSPNLSDKLIEKLRIERNVIIISECEDLNYVNRSRQLIFRLLSLGCSQPIISSVRYSTNKNISIDASCNLGPVFIDGLADGLMISSKDYINGVKTSFGILQATRSRITKPDYISCPGCGRTLFDLQTISKEIREKTSHLKGIKIGIMGCIVNGPGEMADADFGYVGSLKGKVTLYKGKIPVNKNIPIKNAVTELIELIKDNGFWRDPDES